MEMVGFLRFLAMRVLAFFLVAVGLSSCGIREGEQARRVVPPKGSDDTSMPWSRPTEGGGGILGGLLNR